MFLYRCGVGREVNSGVLDKGTMKGGGTGSGEITCQPWAFPEPADLGDKGNDVRLERQACIGKIADCPIISFRAVRSPEEGEGFSRDGLSACPAYGLHDILYDFRGRERKRRREQP